MTKRNLISYGLVLVIIQMLASLKIFVTFTDMTAYAASKDSMQMIIERLDRIEHKIDKVVGY